MQPIRTDGATSVFSIEDVLTYGEPCYYGFVDYIVLSSTRSVLTRVSAGL